MLVCTSECRRTIELAAEPRRSLREARNDARNTAHEARALIAMSQGRPYLPAEQEEPTIRGRSGENTRC